MGQSIFNFISLLYVRFFFSVFLVLLNIRDGIYISKKCSLKHFEIYTNLQLSTFHRFRTEGNPLLNVLAPESLTQWSYTNRDIVSHLSSECDTWSRSH